MNKKILILIIMAFLLSISVYADSGYWSGIGRCYGSNKWCGFGNDANPLNTVGWDLGDPVKSSFDLDVVDLNKEIQNPIVADFDFDGNTEIVFVDDNKIYAYYYLDQWRIKAISEDNNYNAMSLSIISLDNEFTPQETNCISSSQDYILAHNDTTIFVKALVNDSFCNVYNSSFLQSYNSYLNWTATKCAYESETSREYCMLKSADLENISDVSSITNGRLTRFFYDWGSSTFSISGTTTKPELNNTRWSIPAYGDVDQDGLLEVVYFSNNDTNEYYGFTSYEINSYSGSAFMDKKHLDLSAYGVSSLDTGNNIYDGWITIGELSGDLYPSIIVSGVPNTKSGGYGCSFPAGYHYSLTAFDRWGEENYYMPIKSEDCNEYYAGGFKCPTTCTLRGTHSQYDKWDSFSTSPNIIMSAYVSSTGFGDQFPLISNEVFIYNDELDNILAGDDPEKGGYFSLVDFHGNQADLVFENGEIFIVEGADNGTILSWAWDNITNETGKYIPVELTGDSTVDLIAYGQTDITKTYLSNVNNTQTSGNNPPHYFQTNFDTCSPVCVNNNITFSPNAVDDENNIMTFGVDCDGDEYVDFWSDDFYTTTSLQCNFTTVGTQSVNFYLTDNFHTNQYQTDSLTISVYSAGNCYTSGQYDSECSLATISSNITSDINTLGINVSRFNKTDLNNYEAKNYDWGGQCSGWDYAVRPLCPIWTMFKGAMYVIFTSFWTYFGLALMLLLIISVYAVVKK